MAEAAGAAVEGGNTPEQIAEYEKKYDYTGVGDQLMAEAKKWFGISPSSSTDASYYLWRKWNDVLYYDKYFVRSKKAPIEEKATGELAFSPTYPWQMNAEKQR
jgi:hypothetical protein